LENGHKAVRAHVYGCGNCDGETFLSYVERFSPDAPAIPTEKPEGPIDIDAGREFAPKPKSASDKLDWVPHDSSTGLQIINMASKQCDITQRAKECLPPR